jgi:hypothetical protein
MNKLGINERNKTIRIFASVLLISLYVIVTYHPNESDMFAVR